MKCQKLGAQFQQLDSHGEEPVRNYTATILKINVPTGYYSTTVEVVVIVLNNPYHLLSSDNLHRDLYFIN